MVGFIILAGFLLSGCVAIDALMPRKNGLVRLWLGLSAGLMLMMWLPTLFAFVLRFGRVAQLLGLALAAIIAATCAFLNRDKPRQRRFTAICNTPIPCAMLAARCTWASPPTATCACTWASPPVCGTQPIPRIIRCCRGRCWATPSWATAWSTRCCCSAATWLMFINGGLGFLYALDGVAKDATAFRAIFTGFYKTPTNQPNLNLRWSNVICDMMIPQRTLLTGWMALLPALWLLMNATREGKLSTFALLGLWAGAMPMIHTHSFLALGLISAGAMAYAILRVPRGYRLQVLGRFALYGGIALILAAPQLLTWSVPQTVHGGSMRWRFNWVNNQGNGRLIDGYCWFWIKNVGLIWLMMVPAALSGKRARPRMAPTLRREDMRRMFSLGALSIYIVAELVQFQPNAYDNNKLFYVAYMAVMPAMGLFLVELWDRLKGIRGRTILAAVFMLASTLSGALTIAREVVSDYTLFYPQAVHAARYVEENTPMDTVVLTGREHNNPITALAGRDIVCGSESYLYFHGISYFTQERDMRMMFEEPGDNLALLDRYRVEYVYISSYERADFDLDEAWFNTNCDTVFAEGDVCLYRKRGVHWNSTQN